MEKYSSDINLSSTLGIQPFYFAGRLCDPDTGLVRFGVRDYEAIFGRWILKDSVILGIPFLSLFVYSRDDPINLLDPSGFACGKEDEAEKIVGEIKKGFDNTAWIGGALAATDLILVTLGIDLSPAGLGVGVGLSVSVSQVSGLAAFGGLLGVTGLVGAGATVVGSWINEYLESKLGQTFGGWIYDLFHEKKEETSITYVGPSRVCNDQPCLWQAE